MHFKEILEYIEVSARQLPFILRRGQKLLRHNMHEVRFCEEHFPELLEELQRRDMLLGIITSNTKNNVLRFLKDKGIEVFEFLLAASLFNKQAKVKRIMKQYSLEPEEILYVGDEVRDIHSAHAAGIRIASVVWGYNDRVFLEAEKPDWLLEDSREILEILDGER
jgi:phosphoglycolate phosphatase